MTDEELGRRVRETAEKIKISYSDSGIMHACAFAMVSAAHDINSESSTVEMTNATYSGKPIGDWKVTVECVRKEATD